ncbi:hypothetical protein IFJ82_06870 [Novacetimonas hansenii]|uniref:hypothetical protein n=1 Tax=Novacetimonas TaxID=2919364 RepID=UPI001786EC24|nr:hypothetical protein [Novacetimonas hansenii]QOF96279.1 hypothetical protein IFJ82_06870 [Novacetimonas hansenii]
MGAARKIELSLRQLLHLPTKSPDLSFSPITACLLYGLRQTGRGHASGPYFSITGGRGGGVQGLTACRQLSPESLFENNSLIKNKKSFWVLPFFRKAASSEAFWKKLHQKLL